MVKPINFFRNLFPAAGGGSPFTLKRAKYNVESNINDVEEFTAESTRSGVPVPAPPNTDGTYSYNTSENYGLNPNGVVDYPIENRVKRAVTASDIRTTNNNPGTPPSGFTTTSRLEFDYNYQITERASYTDYTPILSGQNGLEVVRRDVKAEEIVLSASVVGSSIGGYEYSSLPAIQIRVFPGQPSNLTEGGSQTFIQLYSDRVLTANLTINITISGTASSSDYGVSANLLGTGNNRTLVMSAGNNTQTFGLSALQDAISEPNETVTFTITSNSNYAIGGSNSATVTINASDILNFYIVTVAYQWRYTSDTFQQGGFSRLDPNINTNISLTDAELIDYATPFILSPLSQWSPQSQFNQAWYDEINNLATNPTISPDVGIFSALTVVDINGNIARDKYVRLTYNFITHPIFPNNTTHVLQYRFIPNQSS